MRFANPEAFLLVPPLLLAVLWSLSRRHRGAARYSGLGAAAWSGGWSVWGPGLLTALRATAVLLVVAAVARPQTSDDTVRSKTEGITILLVIDNSYSMTYRDYAVDGVTVSRLDAVKHAVRLFVSGGEHGLKGRPNDKIGLITFARDPDVVCPATLDHAAVLAALERVGPSPPVGTNIGDGLAWALDRIRTDPAKEKVIVLLSDGSHNVKEGLPPLEAAQLAADLKVRVHTVGAIGNGGGRRTLADLIAQAQGGRPKQGDSVDEPMMRQIAEMTGGRYFGATDTGGLVKIYEEIDRLETTTTERTVRVAFREWYLALAAPGALFLLLEQALSATRLLRVP